MLRKFFRVWELSGLLSLSAPCCVLRREEVASCRSHGGPVLPPFAGVSASSASDLAKKHQNRAWGSGPRSTRCPGVGSVQNSDPAAGGIERADVRALAK